ncbi:MAG: type II toxin-antitoxin system RelE/ParE family toxin [Spirosomataceae bacterium]
MAATIIWTEAAKEDIRDVVFYLMRDSDVFAENWVKELEHSLHLLSSFPEMGKVNQEKEVSFIREIFVGKYRVVYSYLNGVVTLLMIRHQSRPLGKIQ